MERRPLRPHLDHFDPTWPPTQASFFCASSRTEVPPPSKLTAIVNLFHFHGEVCFCVECTWARPPSGVFFFDQLRPAHGEGAQKKGAPSVGCEHGGQEALAPRATSGAASADTSVLPSVPLPLTCPCYLRYHLRCHLRRFAPPLPRRLKSR